MPPWGLLGGVGVGVVLTLTALGFGVPPAPATPGCPPCGPPPLLFEIEEVGNFSNGTTSLYNFSLEEVATPASGGAISAEWLELKADIASIGPPWIVAHLLTASGASLALFNFSQSTWQFGNGEPTSAGGGWVEGGSAPLASGETVQIQSTQSLRGDYVWVALELPSTGLTQADLVPF